MKGGTIWERFSFQAEGEIDACGFGKIVKLFTELESFAYVSDGSPRDYAILSELNGGEEP